MMTASARPVLTPELEQALARVAGELATKSLRQATLDHALAALDRLSPESGAQADARIALAAGLYHQPVSIRPGGVPLMSRLRLFRRRETVPKPAGAEYLFLFHRDGFLREQALHRLDGGLRSPFFFAALAYRLNDWVPQVRHAAHACAMRTFPLTDPDIVAEAAIFLLDRRQTWRRWDGEGRVLDQAIARPEVVDRLALRLKEATTGPMASVLRNALRQPFMDRHLADLAAHATLPPVRATAARALIDGKATWPSGFRREWVNRIDGLSRRVTDYGERALPPGPPRETLIDRAASDRSAAVRRIAAAALIRYRDSLPDLEAVMQRLADDPSPGVRERIAFLRRQEAHS